MGEKESLISRKDVHALQGTVTALCYVRSPAREHDGCVQIFFSSFGRTSDQDSGGDE